MAPEWPGQSQEGSAPLERVEDHLFSESRRFTGTIKSLYEKKGYGFIICEELSARFPGDIFLQMEQATGFWVGSEVSFSITRSSRGLPQAVGLAPAARRPLDAPGGEPPQAVAGEQAGAVHFAASGAAVVRRQGDWDCHACGAMVFSSKGACYKCGAARAAAPSEAGAGDEASEWGPGARLRCIMGAVVRAEESLESDMRTKEAPGSVVEIVRVGPDANRMLVSNKEGREGWVSRVSQEGKPLWSLLPPQAAPPASRRLHPAGAVAEAAEGSRPPPTGRRRACGMSMRDKVAARLKEQRRAERAARRPIGSGSDDQAGCAFLAAERVARQRLHAKRAREGGSGPEYALQAKLNEIARVTGVSLRPWAGGQQEETAGPGADGAAQESPDTCRDFMKGVCTRGAACRFSHAEPDPAQLQQDAASRGPCRDFLKGTCTRGATCKFSHSPTEAEVALVTACRFFAKGICKNGTACRFSHATDAAADQRPPQEVPVKQEPKEEATERTAPAPAPAPPAHAAPPAPQGRPEKRQPQVGQLITVPGKRRRVFAPL